MGTDFLQKYGRTPKFGYQESTPDAVCFPPVRQVRGARQPAGPRADLEPWVHAAAQWGQSTDDVIFDQGGSSSCTAQAFALGVRTRLLLVAEAEGWSNSQRNTIDVPARLDLYQGARRLTGNASTDDGTQIQAVCDWAQRMGLPPEHGSDEDGSLNLVFRDDRVQENVADDARVRRAAFDHRLIDGVHRLDAGIGGAELAQAIDDCIANGEPVVAGGPLDRDFFSLAPGEVYRRRNPIIGRHAMLVVGYDRPAGTYKLGNSWGKDFCDGGFCLVQREWFVSEFMDMHRFGVLPR